jgi:hypothetical protein
VTAAVVTAGLGLAGMGATREGSTLDTVIDKVGLEKMDDAVDRRVAGASHAERIENDLRLGSADQPPTLGVQVIQAGEQIQAGSQASPSPQEVGAVAEQLSGVQPRQPRQ